MSLSSSSSSRDTSDTSENSQWNARVHFTPFHHRPQPNALTLARKILQSDVPETNIFRENTVTPLSNAWTWLQKPPKSPESIPPPRQDADEVVSPTALPDFNPIMPRPTTLLTLLNQREQSQDDRYRRSFPPDAVSKVSSSVVDHINRTSIFKFIESPQQIEYLISHADYCRGKWLIPTSHLADTVAMKVWDDLYRVVKASPRQRDKGSKLFLPNVSLGVESGLLSLQDSSEDDEANVIRFYCDLEYALLVRTIISGVADGLLRDTPLQYVIEGSRALFFA